jgi:hypothetical protein
MIESALAVLRSSWTFIKELMALLKECKISEFIFGSLEKTKKSVGKCRWSHGRRKVGGTGGELGRISRQY